MLAVAASPDASPREKVERGFDAYFTTVLSDDASFRLLLAESTDEDIARHLDAIEHALIEFVDPLIDADLDDDHRRLLAAAVVGYGEVRGRRFWLDDHDATAPLDARDEATASSRGAAHSSSGAAFAASRRLRPELISRAPASRSASRSSSDSMPTESRTRSSGTSSARALRRTGASSPRGAR